MIKTTFKISKMDCPSEEAIIKMKLSEFQNIQSLVFDLEKRLLIIYHNESENKLLKTLDDLNFDTLLISSELSDSFDISQNTYNEKKLLWQVLLINFFFFILECFAGIYKHSIALIADGLDMLADSIVYGLALYAVGRNTIKKNNIANLSGYIQLLLAIFGLIEVLRRFFGADELPEFKTMIIISIFALIGNALSLYILHKTKSKENHIKASMIFTSNDVIVNIGIMLAGTLVYFTHSQIPDLIIGIIVFILVGNGAFRILQLSKKTTN